MPCAIGRGYCCFSAGPLELETNTVERAIRPIGLGRRDALFAGWSGGACPLGHRGEPGSDRQLNKVEPLAWLTGVVIGDQI